jgi:hypothetical protein
MGAKVNNLILPMILASRAGLFRSLDTILTDATLPLGKIVNSKTTLPFKLAFFRRSRSYSE